MVHIGTSMLPEWYIWIRGEREGPYTQEQLRYDERVTAQTLVWKRGMSRPRPLQSIPALAWMLPFKFSDSEASYGDSLTLQPFSPKGRLIGFLALILLLLWLLLTWGAA